MLSDLERLQAMVINLEGWDYHTHRFYEVDETEGKAAARAYRELVKENEELKKRIEANKLLGGAL